MLDINEGLAFFESSDGILIILVAVTLAVVWLGWSFTASAIGRPLLGFAFVAVPFILVRFAENVIIAVAAARGL
jgi:uncharacterized SAM-binding protein YcdF (DUF218 family)